MSFLHVLSQSHVLIDYLIRLFRYRFFRILFGIIITVSQYSLGHFSSTEYNNNMITYNIQCENQVSLAFLQKKIDSFYGCFEQPIFYI